MGLQLPKRVGRVGLWTALAAGMLTLGACSRADQAQIKRLAMPVGATDRAPMVQHLWDGAWLAAMIIGVLVWGLIGYACFKFRRRSDDEVPVQTRYNLPIEILYTVAPVIVVLVLFFFTVGTQEKVLAEVPNPDHTIDVVGQQWSWSFNYVKDDALDGKTSVHEVGTPAYRPTLVLPVDESVTVHLSSPDVIHSFWVPAFLMKMDVVPGRDNGFSFTPVRKGEYIGRCAELCGVHHSRMLFNLKVVTAEQYATYLKKLKANGNTGLALGGSEVNQQNGLINKVQDLDNVKKGSR